MERFTRRQSMVTELGNTGRCGTTRVNIGEETGREGDQSASDRFALLGWSVYILLLRLASFGATSRPLSRLRGWSGLRFSGGGGYILSHIGWTRGGGTVDGGVRAFIGVGFANGLVVSKLLVQES